MAALNHDTRLVMTILFVGTVSGANVFFYSKYGNLFPYDALTHAFVFGLITVGSIMVIKAMFDLWANDKIELYLLDRRIQAYWDRKQREEQQRQKLMETVKNYNQYALPNQSPITATYEDNNVISNEFLSTIQP